MLLTVSSRLSSHTTMQQNQVTSYWRRPNALIPSVQVLDRVVYHHGSQHRWRSAMLRLHTQSMRHGSSWKAPPLHLVGLSLRTHAATPPSCESISIPAARAPLAFNACMDVDSLANPGGNPTLDSGVAASTSGNGTPATQNKVVQSLQPRNLPASWAAVRKDLDGGRVLSASAHVNRPFGHVAGWTRVCPLASSRVRSF